MKPIEIIIEGASPMNKWINLIRTWNRYAHAYEGMSEGLSTDELHKLSIVRGLASILMRQYPDLRYEIKLKEELDFFQCQSLEYGGYVWKYEFSESRPNPMTIGEYTLLDP
jgi:hypothetical protein